MWNQVALNDFQHFKVINDTPLLKKTFHFWYIASEKIIKKISNNLTAIEFNAYLLFNTEIKKTEKHEKEAQNWMLCI